MIRKKAKRTVKKTSGKKAAKRKPVCRPKKEMNPADVRRDIARIVGSGAKKIAAAVMDGAMKGQLAPAKYLLEVAGVYPPVTDGSISTSEEDSLAETLLHRLNITTEPVKLDEDEEPVTVVIPAKKEAEEAKAGAAGDGSEEKDC